WSQELCQRRPPLLAPADAVAGTLRTVVRLCGAWQPLGHRYQRAGVDDAERATCGLDLRADVNPTTSAQEKVRGLQAEPIALERFALLDMEGQPARRIGCRQRTVGATESALASAHAPLGDRQCRLEGEAERSAVAAALEGAQERAHDGAEGRGL